MRHANFDVPSDSSSFDGKTGLLTLYPSDNTTECIRVPRSGRLRMQRFQGQLSYHFMSGTTVKLELRFKADGLFGLEHQILLWWTAGGKALRAVEPAGSGSQAA